MVALNRRTRRPLERLIVGQHGRHRVLGRLGEGGMAETFLATADDERGGLPLRYCIKRMLPNVSRADFEEEAKVHMQLAHSLVVRAYDLDEDDNGRLFLVLEYVDGVDLRKLLDHYAAMRRRMPVALAVYITHEVAEALHYVHTFVSDQLQHLIHRDISPSNILISRDGFVKLADFGIVARDGRARLTRTGVAKGKTPYLAPERFDLVRGVDHRSDLFSLGVVFYEAICGEKPFAGEHDGEAPVMRAILAGEFEPVSTYAPGLSNQLTSLVTELLSNDKQNRPAAALEVVARLESLELLETIERVVAPRRALGAAVEVCLSTPSEPQSEGERVLERASVLEELGHEILHPSAELGAAAEPNLNEPTSSHEILTNRGRAYVEPQPLRASANADPSDSRPARPSPPATPRPKVRPRRALVLAALLTVIVLAVVELRGFLGTEPTSAPRRHDTHAGVPEQSAAPPAPAPADPTPPAAATAAPSHSLPESKPLPASRSGEVARLPSAAPGSDARGERRTGLLVVRASEWGWVYVDGELVGLAPVEVHLPEGPHLVEVSESETDRTLRRQLFTANIKGGQTLRRTFTMQRGGLFQRSSPGASHDKH